mgnify:CR=1 FL=1
MNVAMDWRREFSENPRLRLSLVAVAVILIVSGLLWLGDQRDVAAAELAREQARHARLVDLSESDLWQQRLAELEADRARLAQRFWRAPSEGQAQAEFQAWLTEHAMRHEIQRLDVSVVGIGAVAGTPELAQVAIRINGRLDGNALAGLLEDLSTEQRLVTVRSLRVQGARRQRFELEAVAWFFGLGSPETRT